MGTRWLAIDTATDIASVAVGEPPGTDAGVFVQGARRHAAELIVLIDHKPGRLALTLQAFGVRGVNLMALQSRPERSAPWTYRFYVDIDGATVLFHDDVVTHREAKPGAFACRLGRKERIEHLFLYFGRDAGAVIANPDLHGIAEIPGGRMEHRLKP